MRIIGGAVDRSPRPLAEQLSAGKYRFWVFLAELSNIMGVVLVLLGALEVSVIIRRVVDLAASLVFATLVLAACGGGSDDGPLPTGESLPNVSFSDTGGYSPLIKLRPNGSFYTGREADFGPRNPSFEPGSQTQSQWAIDASASVETGFSLSYAMSIESASLPNEALVSMRNNLRINPQTGLITQACLGFPDCYDNQTLSNQDFQVNVKAQVVGQRGSLDRSFVLRVVSND